MTSSIYIESYLAEDDQFLGYFPKDKLPPFPSQFPKSLIVNTDEASKPGEHWVALVLTKKKCFYFDSFGLPIVDFQILRFLKGYEKFHTQILVFRMLKVINVGNFALHSFRMLRVKNLIWNL